MFQNADDAKRFIADEDVKFVDVRFCDLPGVMQHFTVPAEAFDPAEQLMFDGSSIRGFQAIHESDMALVPDLSTARVDPFRRDRTLNINFFIHDPITGEQYSRDPRNIAKKAMAYLASTGIGDTAYFAPEAEFYVFDQVRFSTSANEGFYHIDSEAGAWNSGAAGTADRRPARWRPPRFGIALGAIAVVGDAVGAAEHVLELSTEYAKERRQFGRAIGSFQAVKHHLADMFTDVEASRAAASMGSKPSSSRMTFSSSRVGVSSPASLATFAALALSVGDSLACSIEGISSGSCRIARCA